MEQLSIFLYLFSCEVSLFVFCPVFIILLLFLLELYVLFLMEIIRLATITKRANKIQCLKFNKCLFLSPMTV